MNASPAAKAPSKNNRSDRNALAPMCHDGRRPPYSIFLRLAPQFVDRRAKPCHAGEGMAGRTTDSIDFGRTLIDDIGLIAATVMLWQGKVGSERAHGMEIVAGESAHEGVGKILRRRAKTIESRVAALRDASIGEIPVFVKVL